MIPFRSLGKKKISLFRFEQIGCGETGDRGVFEGEDCRERIVTDDAAVLFMK